MINILLISHSKKLSEDTFNYIKHMAPENNDVNLNYIGGDGKGGFGNDSFQIKNKLLNLLESKNQTLIFCDMGSSIMVTQSVIIENQWDSELLRIMNAPFLEGAFVAYALYSGHNTDDVIRESEAKVQKIT